MTPVYVNHGGDTEIISLREKIKPKTMKVRRVLNLWKGNIKKLLPGKKVHHNFYSEYPKDSAMSKRFQIKMYYVLLIVFLFLGIHLFVQYWRLS